MAERTRDEEQRKANAKATRRFYLLIVFLLLILLLLVASLVLWVITPRPVKADGGWFSVETITVEGNTKYLEEAIVAESGLLVGQSIFSVKSNDIEEHLLNTFPYYATVEVQTRRMKEVVITVTETTEVAVLYADGYWIPIGKNGKALNQLEVTSDRPRGMLLVKGSTPPQGGVVVGGQAMDEYSVTILQTLLSAIKKNGLTDIIVIDMSNHSDLRMNWRGQIEIRLGNATNLPHEIAVVAQTIPKILEMRGDQVTGVLNVSSYSNPALDHQAVFTPSSLLEEDPPADRPPAEGEKDPEDDEDSGEEDNEDADDWAA